MNRLGVPESEQQELLAYLKNTYKYENGSIVNRRTGRRRKGSRLPTGYIAMSFVFKGKFYCTKIQRIVWALCCDQLPTQTVDHINGNRLDNRIENLRVVSQTENNLNTLLRWKPNKDTNLAGVDMNGKRYQTRIHGRRYSFSNPYEAFYWAIACGKRYKPTPSPSPKGGELLRVNNIKEKN